MTSAQVPPQPMGLWSVRTAQWALGLALLGMYVPTLMSLLGSGGIWTKDEFSHGPLMLAASLWLMWRRWGERPERLLTPEPRPALAWPVLLVGALLFMSGRALQIVYFEVGSAVVMLIGAILLLHGTAALKHVRFAVFFMVFMVPLPGFLLDPIGGLMKSGVSQAAAWLLHLLGYPIARTGVILQMGQYQLLVADACAGMRTLLMLEAFGILYLNVVRHSSLLRNVGLALLIVPISFTANVIRVVVLALITYYWGDEAGQGFLHGFAGIVLFASALALIVMADGLLRSAHSAPAARPA
jgi:exosortase B